jgi:hypothetical protein
MPEKTAVRLGPVAPPYRYDFSVALDVRRHCRYTSVTP